LLPFICTSTNYLNSFVDWQLLQSLWML
jgi:hypothetical protein